MKPSALLRLAACACALAGALWLAPARAAEPETAFQRTEDVIYGRKYGTALTLDIFKPAKPNGYGMIYVVSGGWFSAHEAINVDLYKAFLARGYTVFAVVHGSQPRYIIPEVVQDMHRAVRFIRQHAAEHGIQPDKIGVTGMSAGGHLSITLGTQGGPGKAEAKDPVDRQSSAVQAVACFFPPTDFLNYAKPGDDATGVGTLKDFKTAFGPNADATPEVHQAYAKIISPLYHISSNTAPTLIVHGDADKLVPIYQAELFINRCQALQVPARLERRPGKLHGWLEGLQDDLNVCADWFDEHLRGMKPPAK